MSKPETGKEFIANEWTTQLKRPELNKDQLREWCKLIYLNTEVDDFIQVVSAINARIIHDLNAGFHSDMDSRSYTDFLDQNHISTITPDIHLRLNERKLKEEIETRESTIRQKEIIGHIEREETIKKLELELGIVSSKKEETKVSSSILEQGNLF